jgi:hypothetical protein
MAAPVFTMPGAAPPLAQPSFFTGPQDTLATADAYTANGGVITAIKDQLSNLGISIPDILKGGKALASVLPIVTGIKNGSLLTNPAALATRLLSSSAQITSAFKFLGSDVQNEILDGIDTLAPIAVTVGNLTTQIKTTNFNNLFQVGNLISSFTNDASAFGIVDKSGVASIVGTIVKQVGGYGIPNSFAAVTAGLNDAQMLSQAAGLSLPSVVSNSDWQSLKSISSALAPGAVTMLSPTIVSSFSNAFSRATNMGGTTGTAPMNDSATFAGIMDAYNTTNSGWNSCTRNGTPAGDISALTTGSSDFNTMVSNGVMSLSPGDPMQDVILAQQYGQQTVMGNLQSNFPNTAYTTGNSAVTSSTKANDPRTGGILDSLANLMPGLSLVSGGAEADAYTKQIDASLAAQSAIFSGQNQAVQLPSSNPYAPTQYGVPATSS